MIVQCPAAKERCFHLSFIILINQACNATVFVPAINGSQQALENARVVFVCVVGWSGKAGTVMLDGPTGLASPCSSV